jgi:acyl-CoA synthetase (AMP-forming)/AMP-acid ligase II
MPSPDPSPLAAGTLPEALQRRAERAGDLPWLILYHRDRVACRLTWAELCRGAARWGGALRQAGVAPGDRVVLVLPTGRAFYEAFWGLLWSGAVPVPIYPPVRMGRLADYLRSFSSLLADSGARLVITDELLRPLLRGGESPLAAAPLLVTAAELVHGEEGAPHRGRGEDLALLQYTSGSTGRQKGVMLTHGNLLHNIRAIGEGVGVRGDDVAVSWLPLYHDMGLIGMMLGSACLGVPLVALSPVEFLRRPARWLRLISEHRATFSAGPNFAYSLVARRLRDRDLEGLDLSSWRLALCGAEPVQAGTVAAFTRRFEPVGFRPGAFFPAYGLAENTLAVAFPTPGEAPVVESVDGDALEQRGEVRRADPGPRVREVVSVGRPLAGMGVEIRGEGGVALPEGCRGEVAVSGPSVMAGYYRDPAATAAAVRGGWLHTGDLGFLLGGRLFLCGRSKDLVIKAGRNYLAEDLEAAAAGVPGLRPGGVCAFSVEAPGRGTEEVVLVAERAPQVGVEGLAERLRQRVSAATGCRPDRVVLVPPRTLPKTSSGKLQRFRARGWYLDGSLGRRGGERRTAGVVTYLWAWLRDRLRSR